MAVTLKEIQRWNPEKITSDVLVKAFTEATQGKEVNEADVLFAEGLKQKFKSLMLASMGLSKVTPEHFDRIMAAPMAALETEARGWRIRCAQVMLWLTEHSNHQVNG
jgi:hypothetical protein